MSCNEWEEVKLGEVCDTISVTHKLKNYNIILINTSDVLDGKVLNHQYVRNENLRGQFKKSFQINDILYSEIRPKNKRFAYIDFDASDYVASTKLMVLRNRKNVLPAYLYQTLKSENVINNLQVIAESRSGTFPQITFTELANLEVNLPPLPEQKAIADTLSCLDDKIELNNRINKTLEEMAQAIFKSWFVDFEPFQDGEFEDSELGRIPKGWRVGTLEEVISISTNSINPIKEGHTILEHYSIPAYDEKEFPVFQSAEEIKSNKYIVSPNSYLVSKLNPTTKRIWRPFCFSKKAVCSTEFMVYESVIEKHKDFYFCLMNTKKYWDFLTSITSGSTNSRQRVSPKSTLGFLFVLPTEKNINEFISAISPIYLMIKENIISIQTLTAIRDSLLPKLMSGEIRVPIEEIS